MILYSIVMPDGLGRGGSTKPGDGLHARFPHYGYGDVVEAHHRMLVEGLGIDHPRLVPGTSMGDVQTWMWGFANLLTALAGALVIGVYLALHFGKVRSTRTV
ncbi:alpha/beta hydrolase family protein [Paraburkholderia ferrariae]|uniref:hypothetical protein n=1 Tax=Paraburkholderia ferrariae TaxID=386056 RepID=UPI000AE8B6E4